MSVKISKPKPANYKSPFLSKWKETHVVDIALLAVRGTDDTSIAKAMGVDKTTLYNWRDAHPLLRYALDSARKKDPLTNPDKFIDYVYARLPKELQEVWDQISFWCDHEDAETRLEAMLTDKGIHVRQHLFVHAMVACQFNASEACRRVGVSKSTLDTWTKDPGFVKLLDQLQWHKKNFFEAALVGLAATGCFPAIIHANRTLNRDRGYGDKLVVEGSIKNTHEFVVRIDELDLPLEARVVLRDAIRAAKAKRVQLGEANGAENGGFAALPMPVDTMEREAS